MNITDLPQNVLISIADHLELPYKIRLLQTNKFLLKSLINLIYKYVLYVPMFNQAARNDGYGGRNDLTIITNKNAKSFFRTISEPSQFGFNYSSFVIEMYLESLTDPFVFDMKGWRDSSFFPVFHQMQRCIFPNNLNIKPLTYEDAPNLNTLIIDYEFCEYLDYNKGSVEFFNNENIQAIYFKGTLGKNEDMVLFKLITKFPHMIHRLREIHFLADAEDHYEFVYRRMVGFFAILRKMNLVMVNVHKMTLTLTNLSSSSMVSLISKHVIFENLTELTILMQDDSNVLTLVKTLDKLTSIIHIHGKNIKSLTIQYILKSEDQEKNHLRSMMLLRLCESFRDLTNLNLDLHIQGLNFSNILMIVGTPIANNLMSLKSIRLNIYNPSENLISNILPTLEDAIMLFPHLNFLNNCDCEICKSILEKLSAQTPPNTLFDEMIKVATLLMVGQELDNVQKQCSYQLNSNTMINPYAKYIRLDNYSETGYLLDHLIRKQLDISLRDLPRLNTLEICGMVYQKFNNNEFKLLYGGDFQGLNSTMIDNISGLGQLFERSNALY